MIDYPAARAVALVVQTGSFEGAARALSVTPSAISQRVKQLEERLGAVLVERGAPCVATDKGAWLCRHMEHVGMLEKALLGQLPGLADPAHPAERVTLNVATNADSLGTWFLAAAAAFAQQTDYLLSIAIDDEEDTADWLRRGRVLAAVTALAKPVQGCQVRPLGSLRYHATASPAYIARHFPRGVTPAAIARAPALTFNQKDRLQHEWLRRTLGESIAHPTHWLPSTRSFLDATLLGMGWALNPAPLVRDHLAAGRLVELVPGATLDRPLFWQVNRLAAAPLSALTRAVLATAEHELS
ncbi:LysR family transcriptional regulator ArgP [Amaricoccus sp.]|mgnify:CR=1 FL=1|uniref:LysR family transcriptional regulator ArgP n=1 Tax=Amaricoccus sp. TaxID=1872485 RepID=UPI00263818F3|nr:LysR family transcriptional regulator ArgP [Amaricoccus sp.]HRO10376.1 LysR family transcriptional regulator ArgP [Amaricoccus sp.]